MNSREVITTSRTIRGSPNVPFFTIAVMARSFSVLMMSIERLRVLKKLTISSGAVSALRLLVSKTTKGNFGMTVPISKRTGNPFCSRSSLSTKEKGAA